MGKAVELSRTHPRVWKTATDLNGHGMEEDA